MFYICNCIIVILYIPRHVVRVNKSYLILSSKDRVFVRLRRGAYSQIAYGKLCARLFNYLIWWVRFMVEGWGFGYC